MELPAYEALLDQDYIEKRQEWERPANLDVFFTNMYYYKYHGGFATILVGHFCSIITLGFTVAFSSFLIAFVNWGELLKCNSEENCRSFHHYVTSNPFEKPSIYGFISFLYIALFALFWLWRVYLTIQGIYNGFEMERFYREVLQLRDMQETSWNEILQVLIRLHDSNIHRVAIKERLTEHDIVSRIMRKENFMIALINKVRLLA
jgi:autophagy-related protein 9